MKHETTQAGAPASAERNTGGLSPRMAGDRSNDVDPDSARSQVDRDDTSHEH